MDINTIPEYQDHIRTLEHWPVAGDRDLDFWLISRLHRAIIDSLAPDSYRLRALHRLGHVLDKPTLTVWHDVQVYMRSCCDL